jgi:hypothetical protein
VKFSTSRNDPAIVSKEPVLDENGNVARSLLVGRAYQPIHSICYTIYKPTYRLRPQRLAPRQCPTSSEFQGADARRRLAKLRNGAVAQAAE